jgi:hypothetical protein
MFGFGATRIYVSPVATDMRKSFNGLLHGPVRDQLCCGVETGQVFLFTNARRNRILASLVGGEPDSSYRRLPGIDGRQLIHKFLPGSRRHPAC